MIEMTRSRPTPPSLADPPDWLRHLEGYAMFNITSAERGWEAWPEGVTEAVEFPGGTWRVAMVMPTDLSIADGFVDPLVLLVVLANGAAQVETKLEDLVAHCRTRNKSWTQIGQALGITKQAAWERFSGED